MTSNSGPDSTSAAPADEPALETAGIGTDGDDSALVGLYRRLALVGAAAIILFDWVHGHAEPAGTDPMSIRLILAALCLGIFASTWVLPRRALLRVGYATFYCITAWIVWLLIANDLSENYALALIVVAAGIAGAFQDRKSLFLYQGLTLAAAVLTAVVVEAPRLDVVVFLTYAGIMATLSYLSVSVRLELDRRRAESERRYALAAYGANDGLWDWDLVNDRIYFSRRWKEMLGLGEAEVWESPEEWFGRIHPEDRDHAVAEMTPGRSPEVHRSVEYRIRDSGGKWRWMLARGAVVRNERGEPVRMAGSQGDITDRKRVEEQLVHDAVHDPLTGLPNRTLLADRIERLLAASRRQPEGRFAVIYLDLDRFKRINDSKGHASGDRLLSQVAHRLNGSLREEDTLARVGGDEFVALLPRLTDVDEALRTAERLSAALSEPLDVDGEQVYLTASIGVALGPQGYDAPGELIRDADIAMYRCKKERQNRPQLFDEGMHRQAVRQLRLETELRHAVDLGQLVLHYQPIVLLDSGRVDAWEALVRWRHPERGLLQPAEFLPIAEESGLIVDIGRWALREACSAHRRWKSVLDEEPSPIHVNLSGAHFSAGSILQDIAAARADERVGARLAIEITETVLLEDPASVATVLTELRRLGVRVAIDDFGTGYSSLRYLHSLPADVLKIDRTFVERTHERGGADLIRTIVVLAERLGLSTVAEGIERPEVAARLRAAGASHGQGFLFAPPMEEGEAAGLLTRGTPLPG